MRILILLLFPLFSFSQLSIGILESSRVVAIDADAQAFFDRVTAASGSLTTTEKNAVNQLVISLKAYGIWTKIDAAYPMVGSSSAASAQNLKSSSFTLTFSGTWTFNSSGIVPNGSNTFANTGLTPSTTLTNTDTHISYYSKTNSNLTEIEIGCANSSSGPYLLLEIRTASRTYPIVNQQGAYADFVDTDSRAFYLATRSGTTVNGWRNATKAGTRTDVSAANRTVPIYIGAYNLNGTASTYTNKTCAYASIGKGLTDTEATNYYTAITNFQTTLSRQN
jgi:hypothetical protein